MRNICFSALAAMALVLSACSSPAGRKVPAIPDIVTRSCVPSERILLSGAGRCSGIPTGTASYPLPESIAMAVDGKLPRVSYPSSEDKFRARILSTVNSRISTLRLPVYDYLDQKASVCDSVSGVKSQELLRAALTSVASVRKWLDSYMRAAADSEASGDKKQAVYFYEQVLLYFSQLEEINAIIMASGGKPVELPSKAKIYSSLYALFGRPVDSFEDMMDFFMFFMNSDNTGRFDIRPFSFEDSKVVGTGGRYLADALRASSQKFPEWQKSDSATFGEISGTYWLKDGMLHVVAVRRRSGDEELKRILEASVPQIPPFSKENHSVDAEKAGALLNCYSRNRLKGCGRRAFVATSNGDSSILCVKGEKIKLLASVNMHSYLRIIRYHADGRSVLLLDNHLFLGNGRLNEISAKEFSSFECDGPYGVGFIQLLASPDMFEPLKTEKACGNNYILDTPEEIARNNHGKLKDGVSQRAETWLTITSMEE